MYKMRLEQKMREWHSLLGKASKSRSHILCRSLPFEQGHSGRKNWICKGGVEFDMTEVNFDTIQDNETNENLKHKFTFHICPSLDSEYYFFQRRVVDFRLLKSFCSITLMLLLKRRCHWSFAFSILHQRFQIVVGWLVC